MGHHRTYLSPRTLRLLFTVSALIVLSTTCAFCDRFTSLKWESLKSAFRFHISTEKAIRYVIADRTDEHGYFYVDVPGITQAYENRTLHLTDPRLVKIVIQCYPAQQRVRFVFYLQPGVHWSVNYDGDHTRLLVQLSLGKAIRVSAQHTKTLKGRQLLPSMPPFNPESEKTQTPSKSSGADSQDTYVLPFQNERKLVIIDPGHGGFSKGARTSRRIHGHYYWEKDLVLKIAWKLKALIDKSPNLSAKMTRKKDVYVSLADRVEFAEKNNGDLFISVHLNAVEGHRGTRARGIEIYHWSETGSKNAAVRYLEKLENDQLLPRLPKTQNRRLKRILTSMLKDALEEEKIQSTHLCNVMWGQFKKYPYFRKHHRNPVVKSARFYVLANYAMPSILIEVGFLSNPREAVYLISDSFQWKSARLIYNGIQAYFASEDPNFKPRYLKITP